MWNSAQLKQRDLSHLAKFQVDEDLVIHIKCPPVPGIPRRSLVVPWHILESPWILQYTLLIMLPGILRFTSPCWLNENICDRIHDSLD